MTEQPASDRKLTSYCPETVELEEKSNIDFLEFIKGYIIVYRGSSTYDSVVTRIST